MKKQRICMGCFSEWEEERSTCQHCGWSPEEKNPEIGGYKTGDILEKRYLLGDVYYEDDRFVVRRVFDNVMRIICFILYQKNPDDSKQILPAAASKLMQTETEEKKIVFLSMKTMKGQSFLLFSLKDRFEDSKELEPVLHLDDLPSEEEPATGEDAETSEDETADPSKNDALTLQPHTVLNGHYIILGCVGIGGFGITYLANDKLTGRSIAIKEYYPSQWAEREDAYVSVRSSKLLSAYRYGMEAFLKEIRITAGFIHTKGIVTLYDAFYENDTLYMVMEYVSGISIGRELKNRKYEPFSVEETRKILMPVADALSVVHEKRILHSDISPGNIMRTDEGKIILIDFGAAKYLLDKQPLLLASFLKLDYASPEQYRTAKEGIPKDEGPWTDVYALGATMYYMVTGKKPVDVNRRLSSEDGKLYLPEEEKPGIPDSWMNLIEEAVELDYRNRLQSMSDFREKLAAL